MYAPNTSVIVVSRGRPDALMGCLDALAQQVWPSFEILVVACPDGCSAVEGRSDADSLRLIPFDRPNIAQARNLGLAQAAGEIVAFIDDDARAEPLWLSHLIAPFEDPAIAAATGFVIGRNGISFQWTARSVDALGEAHPLAVAGLDPITPKAPRKQAIKLEGTNMALRRTVLMEMGGFDPAFHYFLDETDLSMRLMQAGHSPVVVPLAQVHHQFEASAVRAADRRPRDLTEIGASKAVFLRKHAAKRHRRKAWKAFRANERRRALRWMQSGPFGADDVIRLMRGLTRGWKTGLYRELAEAEPIADAGGRFLPYPGRPGAMHRVLSGPWARRAALREAATRLSKTGAIVTLILLRRGARAHRVGFTEGGFWEQSGGLMGRADRDAPRVALWRRSKRIRTEASRVAPVRGAFHRVEHPAIQG
ncbi:glycosyltransferase family 2 protein [Cognatishimia sp. F0-27]|uniref:glycosyltransferase family 2 protein n=1 Tax=Cognatishimia sp. F0-27 TaxID=2816855 RepID=UPI001D0C56DF|nr:glycosyltransferase [Cognatishimia sp. F0-27]MCC1491284.1 glycosyltransferase [Cognatishimia sp. F0-27]